MSEPEDIVVLAKRVLNEAENQKAGDPQANIRLHASIEKLQRAADEPSSFAHRVRFQPLQNMCLLMAHEMKLLNILVEHTGDSVTLEHLASVTKYNDLFIMRIMRMLAAAGICDESCAYSYTTNGFTEYFASKGLQGGTKHMIELLGGISAKLVDFMRETGFNMFPKEEKGEVSVFKYAWGIDVWEKLRDDPEHKQAFDELMLGRRQGLKNPWFVTYPAAEMLVKDFKEEPGSVLIVDVAGNRGHDLDKFRQSNKDLPGRFILQDLPETLAEVDRDSLDDSIELIEYDFFTEQPIKGARAYFFRNIVHDWDDRRSAELLSNTAKAMKKGYSRILIDDWVIPITNAPLRAVSADVLMMMLTTGMERTFPQWESLLDRCGLQIEKIWTPDEGGESIIEAALKG